jgi:aspartate 1-decarboxylase
MQMDADKARRFVPKVVMLDEQNKVKKHGQIAA